MKAIADSYRQATVAGERRTTGWRVVERSYDVRGAWVRELSVLNPWGGEHIYRNVIPLAYARNIVVDVSTST